MKSEAIHIKRPSPFRDLCIWVKIVKIKNCYCIASDRHRYLIGIGWQGTVEEESTAAEQL